VLSVVHTPDFDRATYTRLKTVTAHWPSGIRANAEYLIPTMR
jgi:malonate-semialdehyde dehydrogenase (acetylating)/methylmalonate-semialdehyde dehydrogenase